MKMRKFVRIGGGQTEVKTFDRFRDLIKYKTENPNKKIIKTKAYALIGWDGFSHDANTAIANKYKETHGDDVTIVPDSYSTNNHRIRVPMTLYTKKNGSEDYQIVPSPIEVLLPIVANGTIKGTESFLRPKEEYICTFEDKDMFNVDRPADEYEQYISGYV